LPSAFTSISRFSGFPPAMSTFAGGRAFPPPRDIDHRMRS
jgi:hypothetical protein